MDVEPQQHLFKDQTLSHFSSPAPFQVKDSHNERHLRTLSQVQERRAIVLKQLQVQDNQTLTQGFDQSDNGNLKEISLEKKSKSPDYTLPPRYFTPVENAEINAVTYHVVKPTPRHVNVVRPVQHPGRKICHPVPQALRRPPGSSPASGTDSIRLPPKKRRYIPTQEDVGPSSKVGKLAAIDHHETSGFYSYVPVHVMDEYFRELRRKEEEITTEDRELWNSDPTEENDDDKEVAELFDAKQDLKIDYCNWPWIPDIADDTMTATDRKDDVLMSFIQQISPVIISLSPGSSTSNQSNRETPIDAVSNMYQNQADRNDFDDVIISADSTKLEDKAVTERPAIPEPDMAHTELPNNEVLNSEALISSGPKRSMESLRRFVLTNDGSADRPRDDKMSQSEEEQFAEILEGFLEENKDLPPQLKDVILDMLTNMRATVAEQKESILYTAEIYMGECDDELGLAEFERSADGALVVEEAQETQLSDSPSFSVSGSPIDNLEETKIVEVEMDSTGQRIYDEIAAFFGYDGYIDYLSYETSTVGEDTDRNTSYDIDNNAILLE